MSYAGFAAGIVGTLSGVGGLWLSIISYRKSNSLKRLDLRLELHRARDNAHMALLRAEDLRDKAIASKQAVSSATGRLRSGHVQQWLSDASGKDKDRIRELSEDVPGPGIDYSGLSAPKLERQLVDLHRTQGWIDDLIMKFEDSLAEDDRTREHVREQRSKK